MSFVFAFFYLRALNTAHSFREIPGAHVTPPVGWGVVVLALVVVSTASFFAASRQLGDGTASGWRAGSLIAWVLALAMIAAQFLEYYNLHFGATDGGLASVFFGWTAVFAFFWLGAVYWMETLWAQSIRGERPSDIASPARTLRANADGCLVFLCVMVVAALFAFVLLYLIK
jgi:heme/copper-type cytochrome/quinol oxidase subunit 3